MRVIAGAAKGHRLDAPPGRGTRPTSDRVREALFSSLQLRLPGARVLDLFAGSGALGIEALSRGAASATFVERSRAAHRTLIANLERTGLSDDAAVILGEARAELRKGLPGAPFDLALLDPPYAMESLELEEALDLLAGSLRGDALIVLEGSRHGPAPRWPERLEAGRTRRYGDTVLHEAKPA